MEEKISLGVLQPGDQSKEEQPKTEKLISKMLAEKMRSERLSSRKVAKQANVAHTTIMRILNGNEVSVSTLQNVARYLGTDPGGFVTEPGGNITEDIARDIATIIGQDPELKSVIAKAVAKVKSEEISPSILKECVRFVAWRIGGSE